MNNITTPSGMLEFPGLVPRLHSPIRAETVGLGMRLQGNVNTANTQHVAIATAGVKG